MNLGTGTQNLNKTMVVLMTLYLLDPFNLGYIFAYLLILSLFSKIDFLKKSLDSDILLLLLFSAVFTLFYSFDLFLGTQYILIFMFFPASFYLTGKYLADQLKSPKKIFGLMLFITVAFSVTSLISVTLSIVDVGFVSLNRNVAVFWDGHVIPATNMGSFLTFNMCIPALLIAKFKGINRWLKLFMLVIFILSVICVLRLGSRTQLGITIFTCAASIIYLTTKQSPIKNFLMFAVIFVLGNIAFSYFSFDKDSDILSAYASRMDSKKFGASTAGGRTERWEKSLVNLIEEPLGWPVEEFGFSHNLWFDVARGGSVISFLLLVLYTIRSVLQIKKTISINKNLIQLNTLFLIYGLAFLLLFMVEPIFDGYYSLFTLFCFYKGVLNKHYELQSNLLETELLNLESIRSD